MKHNRMWVSILASLVLGASAAPQPGVQTPLVPGDHMQDAPPDHACVDLIRQAVARDAQREFKLAGMLNTNTPRARPMPEMPLIPFGGHRAGAPVPQMDGTARSLYVNCETRQAYVSKRGGVIDITYWYGPFGL